MRDLCRDVADAVQDAVEPMVGREAAGEVMGMGADGTPTKRIDEAAEDAAMDVLEGHGDLEVVSEEYGRISFGDPEYTVAMDPLDGTYNAAKGIPLYAVSLAVADGDTTDDVFYGYVRELNSGSTYTAREGEGAEFDGAPLEVSNGVEAGEMTVGGVYNIEQFDPGVFDRVRLLGCSSLEMCYVAAGRLHGFVDMRAYLRVLDFAAAKLVIEEAGGRVTTGDGGGVDEELRADRRSSVVAAAPDSHEAIMEVVR